MNTPDRRTFMKLILAAGTLPKAVSAIETIAANEFRKLPSTDYRNIFHSKIDWKPVHDGLEFARVDVYRDREHVDTVAALRVNPEKNTLRAFNSYEGQNTIVRTIEEWQRLTGATAMVNSAQYMADPAYMPCALVITDGRQKGPKINKTVRGMLVAEPSTDNVPRMDLLDFNYDTFDHKNTPYTQGVQHWPILLDREGKIKVQNKLWQANRTVVAKDFDKNILLFTAEGGFFTLFNFGRFLKESNARPDKGFKVHTAMNMDGGYEADMVVRSPKLSYTTYGEFETYGPGRDATVFDWKIRIPGVIGVFPRT